MYLVVCLCLSGLCVTANMTCQDVKERLTSAQWAEIEASQYPPKSYLAAMEKWREDGPCRISLFY